MPDDPPSTPIDPIPPPASNLIPPALAFSAVAGVAVAVFACMAWVLYASHSSYGIGLHLVENAAKAGYDPALAASRVFVLASAEQMAAFKVIAFAVSALLALVGGVFILNGAEATYKAGLSTSGVRGALESSSPGLVIVTLSISLAAFTLASKSQLTDTMEASGSSTPPAKPGTGGASATTVSPTPADEARRLLAEAAERDEQLKALEATIGTPTLSQPAEPESPYVPERPVDGIEKETVK